MLDEILGLKEAADAGRVFGVLFAYVVRPRLLSAPNQSTSHIDALFRRIGAQTNGFKFNIFQKARLIIELKRTLVGCGMSADSTRKLAFQLMRHLALRSHAHDRAAPAVPADGRGEPFFSAAYEQQVKGRLDDALASYQQGLARCPDNPFAHKNLAAILFFLGRLAEAREHLQTAIWLKPDYADAYCDLGLILNESGRIDEAEPILHAALQIKPDHREALLALGGTYVLGGRVEEAEDCYRRILTRSPDDTGAMVGLGSLALTDGTYDKAEKLFQRVQALEPGHLHAHCRLVETRKMTAADKDWLNIAEALVEKNLSFADERDLRFAMGKYNDDIGDYDTAFANYRRANELRKRGSPGFDPEQLKADIDRLIENCDAASLKNAAGLGSDSERPIFIVGMPRSGTSLVEQIFASHPEVFGAGELLFWGNVTSRFNARLAHPLGGKHEIRELGNSYLQLLSRLSAGSRKVVDKAPMNFLCLALIHAAFPRARIVHTVRNPIDTCLSIHFQNLSTSFSFASSLADLRRFYEEYRRLMAHWRAILPHGTILDVPYESLVENTEEWTRRILDHAGLDWDERCLRFHETRRRVGTASHWQVRQKIYRRSVERWRNYAKHIGPLLALQKQ